MPILERRMKLKQLTVTLALLGALFAFAGCESPPPPLPPGPPPSEPPPEEEPEPEPVGTAPLVGTVWSLDSQYSAEELREPPAESVSFHLQSGEEGEFTAEGPVNQIRGTYDYGVNGRVSERPDYEEGNLTVVARVRSRATGPYIDYEDLILENLALAQGYYITGERPAESTLVIFGGYGREEIILFELSVKELPPQE